MPDSRNATLRPEMNLLAKARRVQVTHTAQHLGEAVSFYTSLLGAAAVRHPRAAHVTVSTGIPPLKVTLLQQRIDRSDLYYLTIEGAPTTPLGAVLRGVRAQSSGPDGALDYFAQWDTVWIKGAGEELGRMCAALTGAVDGAGDVQSRCDGVALLWRRMRASRRPPLSPATCSPLESKFRRIEAVGG